MCISVHILLLFAILKAASQNSIIFNRLLGNIFSWNGVSNKKKQQRFFFLFLDRSERFYMQMNKFKWGLMNPSLANPFNQFCNSKMPKKNHDYGFDYVVCTREISL